MRAIRFHRHGGPEVLQLDDVPVPEPGPGELRVRVRAVAINRLDLLVRRGLPLALEMPHIGGVDFTGVVEALGPDVTGWRPGDRVIGYPLLRVAGRPLAQDGDPGHGPFDILGERSNGACCEALVLPAANLLPLPEGIDFEAGAALPVVFITAWTMLVERARLAAGETLLVQGASSGVGTAAIQIGKLLGARVIACSRSPERLERARQLGADDLVLSSEPHLHQRVQRLTRREGAHVVFEHVGEATWDESIRSAAYGGRIVTCGATSGLMGPTHLGFVFGKQLSLHGTTLGSRASLAAVLEHVAAGRLAPVIDRVMPLEACGGAHALVESGEPFGKVVLRV